LILLDFDGAIRLTEIDFNVKPSGTQPARSSDKRTGLLGTAARDGQVVPRRAVNHTRIPSG
jgi:hypothetical protein